MAGVHFRAGIYFYGTDNAAHLGGLASGFLIGKVVADRAPVDLRERRRAQVMGWLAGITVVVCFGFMFLFFYQTEHTAPETLRQTPPENVQLFYETRRS